MQSAKYYGEIVLPHVIEETLVKLLYEMNYHCRNSIVGFLQPARNNIGWFGTWNPAGLGMLIIKDRNIKITFLTKNYSPLL